MFLPPVGIQLWSWKSSESYAFIPSYYQRRAVIPTRRFWHALGNIKSAPRIRGLVIAWGRWNAFPIFLGRSGCTPPIRTARFFLFSFFFFHSLCIYQQKALFGLLIFPNSDGTLSLGGSFWEIAEPRGIISCMHHIPSRSGAVQ